MQNMRRIFFLFFNLIIGFFAISAQEGTWSGSVDVNGKKIPLVFHLDGEKPTMDSPMQQARGIAINVERSQFGTLKINIPAIGATYNGVLAFNKIRGKLTQAGMDLPLILTPGELEIRRPQTPQPPFPYTEEEVSFSNGDVVLKGTLTLPQHFDRSTPALVMITGSGLQNRDEEIFEHKPFAVLADALAREGIATLRYDDRGFGASSGDGVNSTTVDHMLDALTGVQLLREKFDRLGVLGHSEGGTIGLMLAADKKVDFVVSLAGMVISGKETLMEQNRRALGRAGYDQEVVDEYLQMLFSAFDGEQGIARKIERSNLPPALKQNLISGLAQLQGPYLQNFLTLDARKRLGEISCPVLAFNGTKDTQVSCGPNLEALRAGLPANPNTQIQPMDGLNHLMQHCQSGDSSEYADIEETISPEVITIIIEWLKNKVATIQAATSGSL